MDKFLLNNTPETVQYIEHIKVLIETEDITNLKIAFELLNSGGVPNNKSLLELISNNNTLFMECLNNGLLDNVDVELVAIDGFELTDRQIETISRFSHLKSLLLNHSNLSVFPEEFCNFFELQSLELTNNNLQNFPKAFTNLKNLEFLNLWDNSFIDPDETIIQQIAAFKNLKGLSLAYNGFLNYPGIWCDFQQLEELRLNFNLLTTLPDEIINLQNLRQLYLQGNPFYEFENEIATKLAFLKNLKTIYLDWHNLAHSKSSSNEEISFERQIISLQKDYPHLKFIIDPPEDDLPF